MIQIGVITDILGNLSPRVDLLYVQEHKLQGYKVERNIGTLWKSNKMWSLEASPSNKADDRKNRTRKGGIALYLHPRLQPLVLDRGSLACNLGVQQEVPIVPNRLMDYDRQLQHGREPTGQIHVIL